MRRIKRWLVRQLVRWRLMREVLALFDLLSDEDQEAELATLRAIVNNSKKQRS